MGRYGAADKCRVSEINPRAYIWINVVLLLWIFSFVLDLNYFIVSCTCCFWYFGEDKEIGFLPILTSTGWAILYHVGSLALGSFVLLIIWPFRFFIQYIHAVLSENFRDRRSRETFGFKSMKCIIDILACFLKYSNKHAYTEIALKSSSYLTASKNGFIVVSSNIMKLGVLHGVNEYIFFLGQLLVLSVVLLSAYITFHAVNSQRGDHTDTNEVAFLLVCFAFSWGSSCLFNSTWHTVSSTLLHCYCIDDEAHKFDGQGAIYASDKLLYALRDLKPGHQKIIGATF